MSNTITTKNGAELIVRSASMQQALALKNAIVLEIGKADIKLDLKDVKTIKDGNLEDFLPIVARLDSSELIQKAVFDCLIHCSYNSVKITINIFDDVEARKDYYEIMIACIKENLAPFFGGLFSALTSKMTKAEESQK